MRKSDSRCLVSAEKFINVEDKEIAYILGFLWADGYITKGSKNYPNRNRISLIINSNDAKLLHNYFNKSGKWNISNWQPKGNRQPVTAFTTSNLVLFEFLESMDYGLKSCANPNKILSIIPKNLHHYWYRGFFDGDGCCYINPKRCVYKLTFTGPINQDWKFITNHLDDIGVIWRIYFHKHHQKSNGKFHKWSVLEITGVKNSYLTIQWMEGNGSEFIGLKRKFDKMQLIKEKFHKGPKKAKVNEYGNKVYEW